MLLVLQNIDWSILKWIHTTFSCGILDIFMPIITRLGSGGMLWIITAIIMLFTKKYRKCGVLIICGLLTGLLVGNVVLKNLLARPRPCWIDTGFALLIATPTDYSFPSGHTLSSVIAAVILTLTNRKFGFFAIPAAVLIAFSRLYLYVHFPSDVFGAAIIGIIIGYLVFVLGGKAYNNVVKNKRIISF